MDVRSKPMRGDLIYRKDALAAVARAMKGILVDYRGVSRQIVSGIPAAPKSVPKPVKDVYTAQMKSHVFGFCPTCRKDVMKTPFWWSEDYWEVRYCPFCGQALRWE